jgi:hypothetical protein
LRLAELSFIELLPSSSPIQVGNSFNMTVRCSCRQAENRTTAPSVNLLAPPAGRNPITASLRGSGIGSCKLAAGVAGAVSRGDRLFRHGGSLGTHADFAKSRPSFRSTSAPLPPPLLLLLLLNTIRQHDFPQFRFLILLDIWTRSSAAAGSFSGRPVASLVGEGIPPPPPLN